MSTEIPTPKGVLWAGARINSIWPIQRELQSAIREANRDGCSADTLTRQCAIIGVLLDIAVEGMWPDDLVRAIESSLSAAQDKLDALMTEEAQDIVSQISRLDQQKTAPELTDDAIDGMGYMVADWCDANCEKHQHLPVLQEIAARSGWSDADANKAIDWLIATHRWRQAGAKAGKPEE